MERIRSPHRGLAARLLTLALVAALSGLLPAAVRAGLGGLTKSVKDKATQAVKPTPPAAQGAPPKFDASTVELSGDVLDKLIACRKAANEATKDRPKLVAREEQIQKELDDLRGKNHDAIEANANQRYEAQNCRNSAWEQLKNEKVHQLIMNTPGNAQLIQRVTETSTAASQAIAAGDTAKYNRHLQELYQIAGITRADTLAIDKKCGQVPPVHPAQIRIDALQKEWNDLAARVRAMDEQAVKIQKEKCGMTEEQLGIAWDRIQKYLEGKPQAGFSEAELQALGERKDLLKPLAF